VYAVGFDWQSDDRFGVVWLYVWREGLSVPDGTLTVEHSPSIAHQTAVNTLERH
jgi:hypothetical protein